MNCQDVCGRNTNGDYRLDESLGQIEQRTRDRAKWRYFPVLAALIAIGAALAAEFVLKAQLPQSQQQSSQQSASLRTAGQSESEVERKKSGCLTCHVTTDEPTMHATGTVHLACVDCHGGDSSVQIAPGAASSSPEYAQAKNRAHPKSSDPEFARSSANPAAPIPAGCARITITSASSIRAICALRREPAANATPRKS